MRILLLTWVFSDMFPGGDTRIAWHLACELARAGNEVHVLTSWAEYTSVLPKGLTVHHIPFARKETGFSRENVLKAFIASLWLVKKFNMHVIHLIGGQQPTPWARWKIAPFVESVFTPWPYDDPRFAEDLARDRAEKAETFGVSERMGFAARAFRKFTHLVWRAFDIGAVEYQPGVDRWHCYTTAARRMLEGTGVTAPKVVVPPGYDASVFTPPTVEVPATPEHFTFVCAAGAIARRKGVHYLIPAFLRVQARHPKAQLVLVGNAAQGALAEFRAMAQGSEAVEFRSMMPPRELADLMRASHALVLPSLGEPFGIVMLEGAACGLPIVATDLGGPADVVEEGKMGYRVEAANIDALAEAMEKLIADPASARAMGAYAARVVREHYTWPSIAQRVVSDIYQPLVVRQ